MLFVHTLGTALIVAGKYRITPNSVRKFALLLHLSAECGRRVSRTVLRDLIFPDRSETGARHSLRELVYQLRQRGIDLDTDIDGVLLPAESVRSDLGEIVHDCRADARRLKAVEGGFLPGYAPGHSEAFTEWLDGYRARATFEISKTLLTEIARARRGSDWMMTERAARACLAVDPLNEEATLALAEILAVGGAKAQAIGLLDRYVAEVGPRSRAVTLPAAVLRRRISERLQDAYATPADCPLLGRRSEMTVLNERLALAKTGESQCVLLYGEPGIGKSRLAAECCSWAALAGWRIERVAIQPNDQERPMAAFVDLVPNVLKLPGALGAAPESLKALSRLTKYEPDRIATIESSADISAAIARAIIDLIDAVAAEAPLVLLIEDVQWLDPESLRTLAGLVSPRRSRRLLVLLTSRESDSGRLFARHAQRLSTLPVGELSCESCLTIVHQSIGEGVTKTDRTFRDWLVSAAGGNPFFLHSLIRHYRTTGQEFTISPTINVLLDQRLATLTPTAMTVLSICVMLAKHSTIDRLVAALEMPHVELATVIRELEVARLIAQSGNLVTPAHWLISEAAVRNTPAIANKLSHRRVALILEAEAPETHDPDTLWECAQHWLAVDENPRAIDILAQYAQHSIEIGRMREAAELLVKAAFLADGSLRHELACKAIRVAHMAGEVALIVRAGEMVDHTSQSGVHDDIELAQLFAQGFLSTESSRHQEQLHECALSPHADRNHRIEAGRALLAIADHRRGAGLSPEAFSVLENLIKLDELDDDPVALKFLVLYHASFGDTINCAKLSRRLIRVAQGARPDIAADLHRYAAGGLWRCGELEEALATFELAFGLAESVGLRTLQFNIASMLGSFYYDIDLEKDSVSWMERAEQIADEVPSLRVSDAYIAASFEIAVTRDDVGELTRLNDVATRDGQPEGGRYRLVRALEISIQRLSGTLVDPAAAIHELTRHHLMNGESGNVSDLETAIAAELLDQTRGREAARALVASYLQNCRRGAAPIAAMLRNTVRRLEIEKLPAWCRAYEVTRETSAPTRPSLTD